MNWKTHGDTTSLMIYDIAYSLCKEMRLPLFHVTMLTDPCEKEIVFGRNDTPRYGISNHELVEVMERSLLYLDNLSIAAKRNRRELFKKAKNFHREVTHEFKMKPKLRAAKFKNLKLNSDRYKYYNPCPPGVVISGQRIPVLKEQEKMITEIATYYKRMDIDMKMIFKCRGRNNIKLRGIEYFKGTNNKDRKTYFDGVASILKKGRKPLLVLIEPDTGIAKFASTDVEETRPSYIYANEISQIQNSIPKDSIIAVKETFQSSLKVNDKSPIYSSIETNSIAIRDKSLGTGVILFFNNMEIKARIETFVNQYI